MFLSMAQGALLIPDELINIHELMFRFLCNEKYNYLQFNIMENIFSKFDSSSFTWNIPDFVIPFLIAYILATDSSKKDTSSHLFFKNLDDYFNIALEKLSDELSYNKQNVSELYHEWTNDYLGRQYFCTLDSLFKKFTKTNEQKVILRSSISELTRILIARPIRPNKISIYVNKMLNHYNMLLSKELSTPNPTLKDLSLFYGHDEPRIIEEEFDFIKQLNKKLFKIVQNLHSYIRRYLNKERKKSSIYKTSVNNFNDFLKECLKYIQEIDNQLDNLDVEFQTFFDEIKNTPPYCQSINNRDISFNEIAKEEHIEAFSKHILKYYDQIKEAFSDFLDIVQKSSGENPERYNTLTIDRNYYSELTEKIRLSQKNLSAKIKKSLDDLPCILSSHNQGHIRNYRYPTCIFYEYDILRIADELTEDNYRLPKDHIMHYFKKKELTFPIWRSDVINFLLDFDQLITEP